MSVGTYIYIGKQMIRETNIYHMDVTDRLDSGHCFVPFAFKNTH